MAGLYAVWLCFVILWLLWGVRCTSVSYDVVIFKRHYVTSLEEPYFPDSHPSAYTTSHVLTPNAWRRLWFRQTAIFERDGNCEETPSVFPQVAAISDVLLPL